MFNCVFLNKFALNMGSRVTNYVNWIIMKIRPTDSLLFTQKVLTEFWRNIVVYPKPKLIMRTGVFLEKPVIIYFNDKLPLVLKARPSIAVSEERILCRVLSQLNLVQIDTISSRSMVIFSSVPRNFFRGGFNKFSWGQRERGSGGSGPLVRGSGGSCNLVQQISFHIVKFS
jgi:hypothetical protein